MHLVDIIISADWKIAKAFNSVSALPGTFNRLAVLLSEANYLKVAPFVFVAVWFWNAEPRDLHRRKVTAGLLGVAAAMALGRALQLSLPFRARPIHTDELGLSLPAGMIPDTLGGWSSFPSDHAVLFGALVGMTYFLSRRLGVAGLRFAIALVLIPRLYIGVHFVSDIVVGFGLGLAVAGLVQVPIVARMLSVPVTPLAGRYPAVFYTTSFFFLTELVQMFGDLRHYASIAKGLFIGTL